MTFKEAFQNFIKYGHINKPKWAYDAEERKRKELAEQERIASLVYTEEGFVRKGAVLPHPRTVDVEIIQEDSYDKVDILKKDGLSFTCIDIETVGTEYGKICSISAVRVVNGEITESAEWLLNPQLSKWEAWQFVEYHGILREHVINSPTFAEAYTDISSFLRNELVVCHHTAFDLRHLREKIKTLNIGLPYINHICTLQMAKLLNVKSKNLKLPTLCKVFKIDLTQHHDALSDAMATAKLFLVLCNKHGITSNKELAKTFKSNYYKSFDRLPSSWQSVRPID